uniref:Methyltransferase type 11 domain-containing protein n=1 Tax=Chromera velia CCMP2878 TaxID=1169474 RepID=A0A0G4FHT7_9ALVE|eukprot:Cvel_16934.t1-p1 / transcript=Cvel_16934.t1 / gene=Cvel_16934 / organism=Chromera_velia_CCMP2878 / gene_product=hypothetical protein / transcript_product=hypothetical protein / location=Cvel_scaffold1327:45306-46122(+) / protein_length=195 / sequence_SO=supercontig / SO=protein_coding / is_pseudo=false
MDDWDNLAAGWDEKPGVKEYAKAAFDTLQTVCTELKFELDPSNTEVLDFGCGSGLLSSLLSPLVNEITAVDASAEMVRVVERKGLKNVNARCLVLSEETASSLDPVDLVVCSSVLAFVPDPAGTLGILGKKLKETGLLIQWDWECEKDDEPFGFTQSKIEDNLKKAELEILRLERPFSIEGMKPLMAVARRKRET